MERAFPDKASSRMVPDDGARVAVLDGGHVHGAISGSVQVDLGPRQNLVLLIEDKSPGVRDYHNRINTPHDRLHPARVSSQWPNASVTAAQTAPCFGP